MKNPFRRRARDVFVPLETEPSEHGRLFDLLLPDPPGKPTSCCGSVLVQRYKYESVVCKCRATCLIPGPMPDEAIALLEELTPEQNEALLRELEEAMPEELRAQRAALDEARVTLPWD
jgi:hypothetical protein